MRRPGVAAGSVTPGAIATAALAILDAGGPGALSFRRVGAALDTTHTTIHRHCGNLEGLLDLCADHLAAGLPGVDPALGWAAATQLRFTALYEVWTAHAALLTLRQGQPWSGPNMLARFVEPALRSDLDAGMTPAQMMQTFRQLYLFTLGCATTHAAYSARTARAVIAALDPAEFPVLTTQIDIIADSAAERDVFRHGLRTLITATATSLGIPAPEPAPAPGPGPGPLPSDP
jgi:AcrR family transcriptional regulator